MSDIVHWADIPVEGNEPLIARNILASMSGNDVEKLVMLLVLVKHDKITLDMIVRMCSRHPSVGGRISKMEEVVALYWGDA